MMMRIAAAAALVIGVVLTVLISAAGGIGTIIPGDILVVMGAPRSIADLYLVDIDHGIQVNLTGTPTLHESHPVWSPDGQFVLFDRMDTVGQTSCVIAPFDDLTPRCFETELRLIQHLGWDADNQTVYLLDRDSYDYQTYRADAITGQVIGIDTANNRVASMVYSLDGRYLAATNSRSLMVVDLIDQRTWESVQSAFFSSLPAFSQDGSKIAFAAVLGDDSDIEIYVVNTLGGDPQQLTHNDLRLDEAPTWSPDGEQIAFTSDRDSGVRGEIYVYVMSADGSNVRRVTFDPMLYSHPAWKP